MKKLFALSICIFLLMSIAPSSFAAPSYYLSTDEIFSMSNYMNNGSYVFSGNWLFGEGHDNHANLSRYSSDLQEIVCLSKGIIPEYINIEGGWVYYLATDLNNGSTSIRRVRQSGTDETVVIRDSDVPGDGKIVQFFIYDGHFYFPKDDESGGKAKGALYRANLDGAEITKIVDKAVYYPYIVGDKLYYQDDNDGCRLYVCNLDGTDDKVFIDDDVFAYITDGEHFYYGSKDGLKVFSPEDGIQSLGIEAYYYAFAYDGFLLYYADATDDYRFYSYNPITKDISLVSDDTYVNGFILLSEGVLTYFQYSNGFQYKQNCYMIGFNGSNKVKIA